MHIIFDQVLIELWPLIDVRILFMLNIMWILIKFCICFDIDKMQIWRIEQYLFSFSTDLWPLIDVEILLMLSILWTNWWILIKFCKCIDIDNVDKDNYIFFFVIFQLSYGPWLMSEFYFHLMSWEPVDGFWWNFVYAVLWLTHEIFVIFSTELWPLIDVEISVFLNIFRNNEWILFMHCYMIHIVTNTH